MTNRRLQALTVTRPPDQYVRAEPVVMAKNIPLWRPWQALTQAEYNAMKASGAWDPNTLYVITPQRVYFGGTEVWPGPWEGGIVNVTSGVSASVNPSQVIPTTTAGNLIVAVVPRATGNADTGPTAVTDSAGQTWTRAAAVPGTAGHAISIWYRADSAPINSVTFTMPALLAGWWIIELAGMENANVLDETTGWAASYSPSAPISLTVNHPSVVFAAFHGWSNAVNDLRPNQQRPDPPWHNFADVVTDDGVIQSGRPRVAALAMIHVEGGATAQASWRWRTDLGLGMVAAAFRAHAEPYVPPPPF